MPEVSTASNAEWFDAAWKEVYPVFRFWLWSKGKLTYRQIDERFSRGVLDNEFKQWWEEQCPK